MICSLATANWWWAATTPVARASVSPLDSAAIAQRMRQFSGEDSRETILQQELLLALEGLARQRPALLQGTLTFQLGQLLLLLTSELATERKLGSAEAFEALCALPPTAFSGVWGGAGGSHPGSSSLTALRTAASARQSAVASTCASGGETHRGCWLQHRVRRGALQWVPRNFYPGVWGLLQHCRGLLIGDKLERRNRLDSALLAEKTPDEQNFAVLVEHLLSKIEAPEYRQLSIEALLSLMAFFEANPDVCFDDHIALDVVIGHAVRLGWLEQDPSHRLSDYGSHKAAAWDGFYRASPTRCRELCVGALHQLVDSAIAA